MMEETKVHFLSVRPGWITGTRINAESAKSKISRLARRGGNCQPPHSRIVIIPSWAMTGELGMEIAGGCSFLYGAAGLGGE